MTNDKFNSMSEVKRMAHLNPEKVVEDWMRMRDENEALKVELARMKEALVRIKEGTGLLPHLEAEQALNPKEEDNG